MVVVVLDPLVVVGLFEPCEVGLGDVVAVVFVAVGRVEVGVVGVIEVVGAGVVVATELLEPLTCDSAEAEPEPGELVGVEEVPSVGDEEVPCVGAAAPPEPPSALALADTEADEPLPEACDWVVWALPAVLEPVLAGAVAVVVVVGMLDVEVDVVDGATVIWLDPPHPAMRMTASAASSPEPTARLRNG